LKNPVSVIYCNCFQAFVERENFFGKDTGKFLDKILLGVSNVCNAYTKMVFILLQTLNHNLSKNQFLWKKVFENREIFEKNGFSYSLFLSWVSRCNYYAFFLS